MSGRILSVFGVTVLALVVGTGCPKKVGTRAGPGQEVKEPILGKWILMPDYRAEQAFEGATLEFTADRVTYTAPKVDLVIVYNYSLSEGNRLVQTEVGGPTGVSIVSRVNITGDEMTIHYEPNHSMGTGESIAKYKRVN
jgi:hypothetical protein